MFATFIASLRRKLNSDGVVGGGREGEAMLLDLDTSLGCGLDKFLVINDWIESLVVLIMVKGSVKSEIVWTHVMDMTRRKKIRNSYKRGC